MSAPKLNWDDTIKPAKPFSLSHNFKTLSLSPDNKRKRRHHDDSPPHADAASELPGHKPGSSHAHEHDLGVSTPVAKRSRLGPRAAGGKSPLSTRRRLEALDRAQLVSLLENLVDRQPQLSFDIDDAAPPVAPAQALAVLQKYLDEVEARLPYGGGHSDYAFLRVRPQWTSFFVALADYTHFFLEGGAAAPTTQIFEFLDGATALVHAAPVWESAQNNALLVRAYTELGEAWAAQLTRAQEGLAGAFMSVAAWDARFQDHCRRSHGRMADSRALLPVMMHIPEAITS